MNMLIYPPPPNIFPRCCGSHELLSLITDMGHGLNMDLCLTMRLIIDFNPGLGE